MKKISKIALIVLASIIGLFTLIILISINDDAETNISPVKEESVVETQPMSKEEFSNTIEPILAENYGENNYSTEWNNDTYIVNVWREGLSEGVVYAKLGNEELLNTWNISVVDSICSLSTTIKEAASTNGLNIDVKINVLNDANLDKILLTVLNGEVLYNVLN